MTINVYVFQFIWIKYAKWQWFTEVENMFREFPSTELIKSKCVQSKGKQQIFFILFFRCNRHKNACYEANNQNHVKLDFFIFNFVVFLFHSLISHQVIFIFVFLLSKKMGKKKYFIIEQIADGNVWPSWKPHLFSDN